MDNALEAVAQAAVRVAAERDRLTKAFEALRLSVELLDPSVHMTDEGEIRPRGEPAEQIKEAPEPPPAAKPEPPRPAPEPPPAPKPEPPRPAPEPPPAPAPEQPEPPPAATERPKPTGIDPEFGLARTPKPRSTLKAGQPREREERLDKIVEYVLAQPDHRANPVDAGVDLGISKEAIGRDFRELEDRKVLKRVGTTPSREMLELRKRGKFGGRQTVQYQFINGHVAEELKPPPKPPVKAKPTLEEVRNAATKLGEFNMIELMRELQADDNHRGYIVRTLTDFVNRGWFRQSTRGWKHSKPVDPGAAARYDAAHAPRGSGVRQDLAGPVAGTGRQVGSSNKEVNEILSAARRQWGQESVEQSGDKHFKVNIPGGGFLRIASTPGSARSINADKAKLRKAGLRGI